MSDPIVPQPLKHCTKCDNEYPATAEYFYADKRLKSGLRADCKICHNRDTQQYHERNHGKMLVAMRHYYEQNSDAIGKRVHLYYEKNKPRYLEYAHEYYSRTVHKQREEGRRRSKDYYRRIRIEDPERLRAKNQRRRARRLSAKGTHTAADIERQIRTQTDSKGRLICWWCNKPIKGKSEVDHRIPLSRGGSNGPGDIVITHELCNRSKHNKMPWEWNGRLL